MKTLQKILVLCLVAALALSLFACGKKKEQAQQSQPAVQEADKSADQLVDGAPGTLTITADSQVTLGYNENGKTLAVVGENDLGKEVAAACPNISGKPVAEAVTMILQAMDEKQAIMEKPYVMIRQNVGSMTPDKEFIADIQDAAKDELGVRAVVITADQLDADGYFNQDAAKALVLAFLGGNAKILSASVMIDGQYIITAEKDGLTDDYQVVGHSGTVAAHVEIAEDMLTEEDLIPEDQQFDIIPDEPTEEEIPQDTDAEDVAVEQN